MIKAFNPFEPIRKPTESAGLAGGQTEWEDVRGRGSASETAKPWKKASDEQESVGDKKKKKQTFIDCETLKIRELKTCSVQR